MNAKWVGRCTVAALGLWLLRDVQAAEHSWPQFRGPHRNGISDETGLLAEWPTNGPPLLWSYTNCGMGYAGVAVADGLVLTAGTSSNGSSVIALSLDGKPVWSAPNGSGLWRTPPDKKGWADSYVGTRATPTIADGRVFCLDVAGRLGAFELHSGRELWAVDLRKEFGGKCNEWGYTESPLVESNRLYCMPGGMKGFVVCLDTADGGTIWACTNVPDSQASNSSCILADMGGVRQVVTMSTLWTLGLDASNGRLLWLARHANRFRENCELPQYVNGVLYVSSGYGHGGEGYRISPPEGTNAWAARQVWRQNQADNLHGGPIVLDGCIYGAGYDRPGAFCMDLATGALKWRYGSTGRSSYTMAGGLLYRLGENGVMALERPNPAKCEPVSSFRIPSAGKSICLTHPVVCNGRLYIRHLERLFAYDIAAK